MGSISLVRVGGVCAILAAVSFIVAIVIHYVGDNPWLRGVPDDPEQWLLDVNRNRIEVVTEAWIKLLPLLLLMGTGLGFYQALRQAGPLLWIGVAAFGTGSLLVIAQRLVVLGVAYELAPAYAEASGSIRPALEVMAITLMQIGALAEATADHLIFPIGGTLFALAILRTSVVPKWMGWLSLVVALLTSLGLLEPASDVFRVFSRIGFIAGGLGTAVIGVVLLRLREPVAGTAEG